MSDYDARPRQRTTSNVNVAAIVVTVLAVALGFFVLRRVNNRTESVTSLSSGSRSEVGAGGPVAATQSTIEELVTPSPTTLAGPPTPEAATTYAGAAVMVANANTVAGSAGNATTVLKVTDFTLAEPGNAVKELQDSIVYYDSTEALTAEEVAKTLGRVLGDKQVLPFPEEPLVDGELGDATVILMLGEDLAEMTEADLVEPYTAAASAATPATQPAATPSSAAATAAADT